MMKLFTRTPVQCTKLATIPVLPCTYCVPFAPIDWLPGLYHRNSRRVPEFLVQKSPVQKIPL